MTPTRLSLDQLFELLANRRRRYVLYYLDNTENAVIPLDELTDQVLHWERNWTNTDLQPLATHRKDIQIALQHNHLPRIADLGFIDYDPRSRTIRNWENPSLDTWTEVNQSELAHLKHLLFVNH